MEATGWASHIAEWSPSERCLLSAAWRPSTLRTYRLPWTRWVQWTQVRSINHTRPKPAEVAQFLTHTTLKLSPASIALHKSMVSTWTDPSISSTLSSDPVILKTLKGIQALRPRQEGRRIRDVHQLRLWISWNPPSLSSFFEISRHGATLLLLASGRRVHDLTLLLVTEDRLQRIPPDRVFLAFDSKTDSNSRSQSGWRLSPNTSEPLWNIVHWIDVLLEQRKQRCGSHQLSALFISTRGSVKPASRAMIAN
uniref:Core-binding (CB) domain-containing protein n=1 Tax=Cacopsylla melanoneura TaxID=428564 RepID=A0A8D9AHR0_9HEMI